MWTLNSRNECGTKHFRGISSDRDLTDEDSIKLSNEHLRNGDEAYLMDIKKVKLYDEGNKVWKLQ